MIIGAIAVPLNDTSAWEISQAINAVLDAYDGSKRIYFHGVWDDYFEEEVILLSPLRTIDEKSLRQYAREYLDEIYAEEEDL